MFLLLHPIYSPGIGGLWYNRNVAKVDDVRDSCDYVGTKANQEFAAISGCSAVPVEQEYGEGTQCVHWDEDCMRSELMTGFINSGRVNALSRITIGSLDDMGYQVDYSMADAYGRADLNPNCTCSASTRRLRSKIRKLMDMKHGEVFTLGQSKNGQDRRRRRRLSAEGEAMATEAGLEYLSRAHITAKQTEAAAARGLTYVGGKVISVMVIEDGEVFGVAVRRLDE
jgi:Leishmanolysin